MDYPVYDIPYNDFLNYLNSHWTENGEGDITGIIGNNVTNALYQYITHSYINWQTADIISLDNNSYQLQRPVNVILSNSNGSIYWGDNSYNEYVLINTSSSAVLFTNGSKYYDLNLVTQNKISAGSVVVIYKAKNGLWIQGNSLGASPTSAINYYNEPIVVGTTRDREGNIIINDTDTQLIINQTNVIQNSTIVFAGGSKIPKLIDGIQVQSCEVIYESDKITINFLQSFNKGDYLDIYFTYLA